MSRRSSPRTSLSSAIAKRVLPDRDVDLANLTVLSARNTKSVTKVHSGWQLQLNANQELERAGPDTDALRGVLTTK